MICPECKNGGHVTPGRRGWRKEVGHWYRIPFGNTGDYSLEIRLAPWVELHVNVCKPGTNRGDRGWCTIMLHGQNNYDRHNWLKLEGNDVTEAKRKGLAMASSALERAAEIARLLIREVKPERAPEPDPPAVKRLRKAIAHAEAVLAESRERRNDHRDCVWSENEHA